MKLRELKLLVDRVVETSRDYEDPEVVVSVKLPYSTVGAIPLVSIKNAYTGFDWESGKYILTPEENLTPADRDFAGKMKKMQEDLGWEKLENRRLKSELARLKKQIGIEE